MDDHHTRVLRFEVYKIDEPTRYQARARPAVGKGPVVIVEGLSVDEIRDRLFQEVRKGTTSYRVGENEMAEIDLIPVGYRVSSWLGRGRCEDYRISKTLPTWQLARQLLLETQERDAIRGDVNRTYEIEPSPLAKRYWDEFFDLL